MLDLEKLWPTPDKHLQDGIDSLKHYIENKRPVGDFLKAVLCNDLKEAFRCADDINQHLLRQYVGWLYNNAPIGCWGSVENYENWLRGKI